MKNIGSTRTKGVNVKITSTLRVKKPIFMQSLKCVGAAVIEFCFFNRIPKKKMKNMKNSFMNIAHILHQVTLNF